MSKVFVRKSTYNYTILRSVFFEIMDAVAAEELIKKNSKVLIKPNLLAPASPDKAVVTHPFVIKAAVEYVLQRGAHPVISDSPATGSFDKILRESGIKETLGGLPVEYKRFNDSEAVAVGEPFKTLEIARDALHADIVINLPKLKTHTQMLLTLGVKNLFGCIVGMRKPEWHLRAGVDREMFSQLLVKVYQAVKPALTFIDGVLAMHGQGPGKGGTPIALNVLMGSRDTAALDIAVCKLLGIEPKELLTNKIALKLGLVKDEVEVDGELPEVRGFNLPSMAPLVFGPERLHGFMRRHLIQRPQCNESLCEYCGECWKYCPAEAISPYKKSIHFNYDACIRCY
jgi:uncharacterized protein (DUF362 family)